MIPTKLALYFSSMSDYKRILYDKLTSDFKDDPEVFYRDDIVRVSNIYCVSAPAIIYSEVEITFHKSIVMQWIYSSLLGEEEDEE